MYLSTVFFLPLLALQCLLFSACNRNQFPPKNETEGFRLGDTWVPVRMQSFGNNQDTAYLLLHHDESAAAEAAQIFLPNRNGRLLQIINNRKRKIGFRHAGKKQLIDPNRIFTEAGISKQVGADAAARPQVQAFSKYLLDQLEGSKIIIALHSNSNGDFSVHTYKTGELRADAADVFVAPNADADDFVLTTDARIFERCKLLGLNSVLQNNTVAADDGSASIYFGKGGTTYINIEAQDNNPAYTLKVLQLLLNK